MHGEEGWGRDGGFEQEAEGLKADRAARDDTSGLQVI